MKTKPIMIATDKDSILHLWEDELGKSIHLMVDGDNNRNLQHVYLVSDDEIKDGNYYLNASNELEKCENKYEANDLTDACKKIIASTDKSLNLPYLDLIKDSWIIYYYNKNGKLPDEIEVEYSTIPESTEVIYGEIKVDQYKMFPNLVITKQPTEKLYTRDEVLSILIDNGYKDDAVFDLLNENL